MTESEIARRMLQDASDYSRAAEILSRNLSAIGNAQPILATLAFEILLKAAVLLDGGSNKFGHDYKSGWNELHEDTRAAVLLEAQERLGPDIDFSALDDILDDLRFVFVQARYGYEINGGLPSVEIEKKGREWIENGSELADAEIRYRPEERYALSFALENFINQKLALKGAEHNR